MNDARQLFRLLREAPDGADDAQLHILEGLCRIVHARVATSGLISGLDHGAFELTRSQCAGATATEITTLFSPYVARGAKGDPMLSRMLALPLVPGVRVHRRRDLMTDADWYGDEVVAEIRRPMHLDDTIHAYRGCGRGALVGLQIVRDSADGRFDERDRNLVALMLYEAAARLAPRSSPTTRPLRARERQTLECLLAGDSEKQAAAKLGLSVHTLHDYVKRLYRAFGVASRGELMARVLHPSRDEPSPRRARLLPHDD
jgi:DNA-binding CsgD family transcriptional regulator